MQQYSRDKSQEVVDAILTVARSLRPGVFAAGITGPSNYDLAVANGFVGTEIEYLASLEGSMHVGATDPGHDDGRMWLDTGSTGTTTEQFVTTDLTSNTTLTDAHALVFCSGIFTVTLPAAATVPGRVYRVINTGMGTITIDADGVELINGLATQTVSPGSSPSLVSDSVGWRIF